MSVFDHKLGLSPNGASQHDSLAQDLLHGVIANTDLSDTAISCKADIGFVFPASQQDYMCVEEQSLVT